MSNDDDFETFDAPGEGMPQQSMSAAEIFRNNPSLKIFAIVAVIGIVAAGFIMIGGGNSKEIPVSKVAGASDVVETPGSKQVSPEYEKAIKAKDKQNLTEALKKGKSVFPTPISKKEERVDAPEISEVAEDPLKIWREQVDKKNASSGIRRERTVESLLTEQSEEDTVKAKQAAEEAARKALEVEAMPRLPVQQPKTVYVKEEVQVSPTIEEIEKRSKLVSKQMGIILESKVPQKMAMLSLGNVDKVLQEKRKAELEAMNKVTEGLAQIVAVNDNAAEIYQDETPVAPEPIIMPGDVAYAQMMTEANSEIVGPVLAYIASGPLAGARALGTFSSTDSYLVLTFNSAVLGKKQYAINAYAVDPQTTLTAVATDVDNHYFGRVIIPAAANFLQGFAKAVTESGSTTVTVSGETVTTQKNALELEDELLEGASEAIDEVASIVEDQTPDKPTVRVETGTRFGLLFMQPVYEVE